MNVADHARAAGYYWIAMGGKWSIAHWTPNWGWNGHGALMTFQTQEMQQEPGFMIGARVEEPTAPPPNTTS